MDSQVFQSVFTLAGCLGAGLLLTSGIQTARGRSGRLERASAIIAGALALVSVAAFALGVGKPSHLLSGFANPGSGVSLMLYAAVLFVASCVATVVSARRSEEGVAPRWMGAVNVVVALILVAGIASGFRLDARLGLGALSAFALMLGSTAVLGTSAELLLSAAGSDSDGMVQGRAMLLAGSVLAGLGVFAYLAWQVANAHSAGAAVKASLSMSGYAVGAATGASADAASVLFTQMAGVFWGLAVVVGIVVPAACGIAALVSVQASALRAGVGVTAEQGDSTTDALSHARRTLLLLGLVSLVCALAGGWALRICLAAL